MTAVISPTTTEQKFCTLGKAVVRAELEAVKNLEARIDAKFSEACQMLLTCKGRIVVLGMGKSGHIGNKIAATLASTGTPAFFVHPGEASHGDLGMITSEDVVIAISYSGETPELLNILPLFKCLRIALIALTGQVNSTLAKAATVHLDVSVNKEACPLGLAPTSSTTVSLVMGDALAIALLEARGFTADDFARFHPGGLLGRRLLLHTDDIMHRGEAIPMVDEDCLLRDALIEMTLKCLGMTIIVDSHGKLSGVFTDGDLRRTLDYGYDIQLTLIKNVMTKNCLTITPSALAIDALNMMRTHKITSVVVIDPDHKPLGVVHMHKLLTAGLV